MKVQKKGVRRVYSSRKIKADDELDVEDEMVEEVGDVSVDPEATELVFEAEDVAELLAEATGEEVSVTVDENEVVFAVGEDEFSVQPDGDEEIMESTRKVLRGKRRVAASRKVPARRVARPAARPAKKVAASARPIRRK